jgi:hypothetical protein
MKFTITLHPVSLAVGAAALGGVLWLVSAVQAPASTGAATARAVSQVPLTISNPIEIKGVPTPGSMVQIREGTPYVVPVGRVFVLTALGLADLGPSIVTVNVNGVQEATVVAYYGGTLKMDLLMDELPAGLTAPAGAIVSVVSGGGPNTLGRAWGYLAVP